LPVNKLLIEHRARKMVLV